MIRYKNVYCIPRDGSKINDMYYPLNKQNNCDWHDTKRFRLTTREIKTLQKEKDEKND